MLKSVSGDLRIAPPEQTYGGSTILLEYVNEGAVFFTVSFNAIDALVEWGGAHVDMGSKNTGINVLKASDAKKWSEKRADNASKGETLGNVAIGSITTSEDMVFDWTYSTPYSCSFKLSQHCHPSQACRWEPCEPGNIKLELLTDTTAPILMFSSVNLYEDDLHDFGDVNLSAKLRVMPKCFYVLQRLVMRVDGVIVRIRDTRVFHEFGSNAIFMDTSWRELPWSKLAEHGLPTDVVSWRDENVVNRNAGKIPLVAALPEGKYQHAVMVLPSIVKKVSEDAP
jgi:hypothetical protein